MRTSTRGPALLGAGVAGGAEVTLAAGLVADGFVGALVTEDGALVATLVVAVGEEMLLGVTTL
jgi:hypothetical protein